MKNLRKLFAILSVVTIMSVNIGVFAEPEEGTSEKYGGGTSKIISATNQDEGEKKNPTSKSDNKKAEKATEDSSEKSEKTTVKEKENKSESSEEKTTEKSTTQKAAEKTEKKSETKTVATIKPEEKKEEKSEEKKETEKKESSKNDKKEETEEVEKETEEKDSEEKEETEKEEAEKESEEKEKEEKESEEPERAVNKGKNAEQINANKYLTKSGALGMFLLTVLVSAIVSFLISYRFYKMKKSDNYLSSEIRALKRDIDSKMAALVNGVSEYEVKTTNLNPDYSDEEKGLGVEEDLETEEETVDIYSKWERQINSHENESKNNYDKYDSEDDIDEYIPRMERNRRDRNQRNDRYSKTRKNSKGRGTYPDRFSRDK